MLFGHFPTGLQNPFKTSEKISNILQQIWAAACLSLDTIKNQTRQYWPGSRAERPILSSAPCRGGGGGGPPSVYWQAGGGTYIYSLLYTYTGLLGRLLMKFYSR